MQPRVLLGLAGLVALGTLAYFSFAAGPGPTPTPTRHAPAPASTARDQPDTSDRDLADAVQRVIEPPPEPELRLPPAAARRAAEASFEAIMQSLETLGDAGKRLPRARRDELYRNTNDAFAALSATLDAEHSPEDRQTLEDANIRMKAMLTELGVRVPKQPPPRFDP